MKMLIIQLYRRIIDIELRFESCIIYRTVDAMYRRGINTVHTILVAKNKPYLNIPEINR